MIRRCIVAVFCGISIGAFVGCSGSSTPVLKTRIVSSNKPVIKVEFFECETQSYGYDDLDTANPKSPEAHDYISLEQNGLTTKVNVKVEPLGFAGSVYFVLAGANGLDATAPIVPASVSGGTHTLTIKSTTFDENETHRSGILEARAGSKGGPLCDVLGVEVYKTKTFEASYYRVLDQGCVPASDPTQAELLKFINKVVQQGVMKLETLDYDKDMTISYDWNENGILDYYLNAENVEYLTIHVAGPNPILYVKELRGNFVLGDNATAGNHYIDVLTGPLALLSPGEKIFLGPAIGDGDPYIIADGSPVTIPPDKVRIPLTTGLSRTYSTEPPNKNDPAGIGPKANRAFIKWAGVAGVAADEVIVTDGGGELLKTICHELLHKVGMLKDITSSDNIMFYATKITDERLRKRNVIRVNGVGPSGGGTIPPEAQWDIIPR